MSYSTITPPAVSPTAVAMTVWSYSPRSLTDIQSVNSAIQNNDPSAVPSYSDYTYLPVPYYAGQVTIDQLATFVDNAVRNYNLVNVIASLVSNNPYGLWSNNFIANLLSSNNMTPTSASMILSNQSVTATQAAIIFSLMNNITQAFNIISNSALSGTLVQTMLYTLAQNYYYNKELNILTYNAGSTTISTNVTISTSVIFAQSLTISTGVTVTCGLQTCYFITQQFNNYGTIVNQNGAINAGGPGTGGGGIVIIAGTNNLGSIVVAGGTGGPANSYDIGNTGVLYVVGNVSIGIGGTGGYYSSAEYQGAGGAPFGVPGGGGGNTGGPVILNSFSSNNAMLTYILQGVSDWWQIHVLNKSPASTTPLLNMYGAGGGGGNASDGGGEGGEAIAYGYVVVSGNINAQGGNSDGSNGLTGSGGGGGGVVYVFYGLTAGSVSINVAGGGGGNASHPGGTGGTGIAVLTSVTVNG